MKLFYINFRNEEEQHKTLRIIAKDEKNAKILFIKYRNLELDKIDKINEGPIEIENINGAKYKVEYKEIKEPKKIEFGGIEFSGVNEIVEKGF